MKKIIKIGIILLVSLGIIYFGVFSVQNYSLKDFYRNNYIAENEPGLVSSVLVRCNYNILDPEIADVYQGEGQKKLDISFHKPKFLFNPSSNDWENSYTGGTTVKNTTFPQLLKMVKEDCHQFQKSKGDFGDKTINWSYSKYEPEPELSKEEEEKRLKEKIEKLKKIERGEIKRGKLEGFVLIEE